MPLIASDWSVDRSNGNIRYIGADHSGVAPSYTTVLEFHRWLQDLADDALATGNDELDITNTDPSRRSTDNIVALINGYNITDTEAEHIFDGSILQDNSNIIYDGIVNFGNASVQIQIQQNGVVLADDWWNYSQGGTHTGGANASVLTDSALSLATDELVGFVIKNVTDGSYGLITANTATTITATLSGGTDNDWDVSDAYLLGIGLNADAAQGISHRFMIKTKTGGTDIDGRRLLGINRTYSKTYGEFRINGTSRGNNVLALSDASDLNNTTDNATVGAYTDIYITRTVSSTTVSGVNNTAQAVLNVADGTQFTAGDFIMIAGDNSEYQIISIATNALTLNRNLTVATAGGEALYDLGIGFSQIDVDNNTVNEDYYSEWDKGAKTVNQFYERLKWLSQDNSDEYVYGISGELFRGITHEIQVDTATGTFAAVEAVSWTTGTGQMLAINSPTAGTRMWIQLLSGIAPTDGAVITGGISGATVTVDTNVIDRSALLKTPFVGQSTGSALIGSYGLTLETADLTAADSVFDLTNTLKNPPNNVQNTVAGLADGEDRVLVAPWNGSSYDVNGDPAITKNQLSLNGTLSATNVASIVVDEAIPTDTPSAGTIRVTDNNGFERRLQYTSWTASTFTINVGASEAAIANVADFDTVAAASGNDVYVTYIDKLADGTTASYTSVQNGTRNLVVLVRDGGGSPIKQFVSEWSQTSAPQTISAIRTTDE